MISNRTQAANADVLGDDAEITGVPQGAPGAVKDKDGRSKPEPFSHTRNPDTSPADVKPGRDVDASQGVKDRDGGKDPQA